MEQTTDNIAEIKQTWKKLKYVSRKVGLREGISSGRESNFQKNFDIGFKEGFKNGYALGKYKGSLISYRKQHSSEVLNDLVEPDKVGRANCLVCVDEQLLEEDISKIIRKQTELCDKKLNELNLNFDPNINL